MLAAAVRSAAAGVGCVVLVGGEAGIGKTSLVRALEAECADEIPFLTGGCEALSVPVPLAPLRELSQAAGAGDLASAGAGDPLTLAGRLLTALAGRAPAVAVIEDAHWADPLTLDLVRILARRIEPVGVVLIVTYRDDEAVANPALALLLGDLATSPAVVRVALAPLSPAAVRRLAEERGLEPSRLLAATGGNPFLVVETIAGGGTLPASVRDAALARVGRLSAAARRAIDAAAVIGGRFDPGLLEAVVPGSGGGIEEALARGVLVADGGGLRFRHDLIREAIETSISPVRRSELHAAVVFALRGVPGAADNARLAHHAERAGLAAEACRYATLASAEAERLGALRETQLQAARALALAVDLTDDERFELLMRHSRAANFASTRYEDAVHSAEAALAIAERAADPLRQGQALGALAGALWSFDRTAGARAAAERAIAVLEPTREPAARARAHATYIRMEAAAFNPDVAVRHGPQALRLAADAGLADVCIDISISVALARGHRGEGEALTLLRQALDAARAAGLTIQVVRAYVNLAFVAALLRDHALADEVTAEALTACEELHTPIPARAIEGFRARSLLDRGRWDDAVKAGERSARIWHAEVPLARAIEGLIRERRGEGGGEALIREAWQALPAGVEGSRHAGLRVALAEAAWLRGDVVGARAHLPAPGEWLTVAPFARPAAELALWGRRLGVAPTALPGAPPPGAPPPVRLELAGEWRAAVRAWRELEAPYEAALAALPGDERAARQALAALHRLGASAAARAFTRDRVTRGARPARGPRRSTAAHPAGLTRREQEVLEALATGATNPAIAAALHLSERTVAHHVSAILGKLGVADRAAAVRAARARGLVQDGPAASAIWAGGPMSGGR